MEKICIARRRNVAGETQRMNIQTELPVVSVRADQPGEIVSVSLSPEQCRRLQANGVMGQVTGTGTGPALFPDGRVVFNFHFKKMESIKMLKPEHVCLMLQIGKGSLAGLVKAGEMKSYKIGRSRRFLLTDVVDYLEKCAEFPESMQLKTVDESEGSSRSRTENQEQKSDSGHDAGVVRIHFGD